MTSQQRTSSTRSVAARVRAWRARLQAGDAGAVAMLFAMCGSMMIGSMCMALDAIDYAMTQGRMQMALDAATLSSGANLQRYGSPTGTNLQSWQKDARAYYDANNPTGMMGFSMPDANFSATLTGAPATGQTIALSASGSLPLLAPKFLSTKANNSTGGSGGGGTTTPDTSTVSASNSALRMPQSTLELVMVLDNTGSMNDPANGISGATKMSGLQTAANSLIGDLLPAGMSTSTNKNFIGLVPFASTVNTTGALPSTGSWLSTTLPTYNTSNISTSTWNGCVIEPRTGGNLSPEPYSPTDTRKFQRYYYNVPTSKLKIVTYSSSSRYRSCNTTNATSSTSSSVPVTLGSSGGANQCSYPSTGQGTGIGYQYDQSNSSGQTLTQNSGCLGTSMTFLTQSSSTLTAAVKKMTPSGSTIIPVGLLWGWRMLEPSWSQNVAGTKNGWTSTDPSLPKPTDGSVQNLQRVMIVLTDGQNQIGAAGSIPNTLYFNGLSGVGTNSLSAPTVLRADNTKMSNALTDSSELHNGNPIDSSSGNNAGWPDDANSYQQAICSAIKAEGITIYAITFGASASSSSAKVNMQNCASPGNYYNAPDNTTLDNIFQQIAGNLGVLRLTQ